METFSYVRVRQCVPWHLSAFLDTQTKKHPSGHPKKIVRNFLKCLSKAYFIDFCHLHVIPMRLYKDIMPYFDKSIYVYGWNLSILWSPLRFWKPKYLTIANFAHPLSKSWLSPWCVHSRCSLVNPLMAGVHRELTSGYWNISEYNLKNQHIISKYFRMSIWFSSNWQFSFKYIKK